MSLKPGIVADPIRFLSFFPAFIRVPRFTRCFLLILLLPLISSAQQFNFKVYSVEDGIAQSQVYAMIEDSRGYLWMGTRGGGITRFDGLNFKTYSTRDGLSNNYIGCILEDKDKNLWFGTNNGLSRYNGLKFENFYPEKSLEPVAVQDLLEVNGILWLATNKGVYLFDIAKKTFSNFSVSHDFLKGSVTCVYQDKRGRIWIASDNELGCVEPDTKSSNMKMDMFTKKMGLPVNIRTLCEDARGNLWLGTYGSGVFIIKGNKFFRVDKNADLYKRTVLDLFCDSKGNMWIGTLNDGVCKWNPADSSLTWLNTSSGLSNNHVRVTLEDKWGSYWFGTSGGGICKYYGQLFTHFTVNSGLNGNFIYSVFCDSQQRIWIGNSDKGVCVLDSGRLIPYSAKEGFRNAKVRSIGEAPDSSVWIGTDGEGLSVFRNGEFHPIKELKGKFIRDIRRDTSGNMWVATAGGGIYKMIPDSAGHYDSLVNFTTDPGKHHINQNRIVTLSIDRYQRVWFGTESAGIGFIKNDSVGGYIREKDSLVGDAVRSLVEDAYGYLWAGTAGNGISRISIYNSRPEVKNIRYSNGLTSSNIYLLAFDKEGDLFAGSEAGLDKITLDKERNVLSIKHYGKAEGFTGIETCQNAVCRDSSGSLWFGTINGLTRYNAKTTFRNEKPPFISISEVSLFYEPLQRTKYAGAMGEWNSVVRELIFPHDENHLSFDLTAVNLSNPENVKLSWKLEGFDKDWSPPSEHSSATYSNLPPGDYTFLAKAYNEDGVCNTEPVKLHFVILKPFWAEWWFLFSITAAAALLVTLIFRVRVAQVRRRGAEQRRRLQMEKSMVELEQKALRLQMNPHFIFNALNSIQSLISQQDEQTARFYLAKFSKLMRMILENSRNANITLEDEIKTLENYLALEKFCSGDTFDFKVEVEEGIDTSWITLPPMMIQPFVENAVIHGLKHLDHRGLITIHFGMRGETLECSITDNGIGREKAAEINKAQREEHHKSTALKVTQERLDLLQKENNSPSLEIIDLKDENGNAKGTRIIIRVTTQPA